MKTVAIMACCDTKQEEALFLSNFIQASFEYAYFRYQSWTKCPSNGEQYFA